MEHSVLVVDTNPQHDLAADYQWLLEQGIYPGTGKDSTGIPWQGCG
jgi:hypothetical protein